MTSQAQNEADYSAWIRLTQINGIGVRNALSLLKRFGLPENIFSANKKTLVEVISPKLVDKLLAKPEDRTQALIKSTLNWLNTQNAHIISLADERYPRMLLEISDPPILLYAKGRIELLSQPGLAIVGSRNASVQGIENAHSFAQNLSKSAILIISGLALGIDSAAHQGGLLGNGSTLAVIGTGIDTVYPARNRDLANAIAQDGLLLSEYPLGTPGIALNFPRRNRIISGLAHGVLVVESALRSGSLITARQAVEQGREVFAIPGSIHSPLTKGCHQLIKQGAKLVESAQDILEELNFTQKITPFIPQSKENPTNSGLLLALGFDPVTLETLSTRTQSSIASLLEELLTLELLGQIEVLADGRYQRLRK